MRVPLTALWFGMVAAGLFLWLTDPGFELQAFLAGLLVGTGSFGLGRDL